MHRLKRYTPQVVLRALLLLPILCPGCTDRSQSDAGTDAGAPLCDSAAADSVGRLTLLFAGDLMQHDGQIQAARTPRGNYDYAPCFEHVREEIGRADVAIANFEVSLGGRPYKGYPRFSAPDEFLTAVRDAGFDVLLTANNHCLDTGRKGLERTVVLLDSLHIPHAGTYVDAAQRDKRYPLLIERNGIRVALLNYTYGTNGLPATPPNVVNYIDRNVIEADIERAKAMQPDAIIACMHWGTEYELLPSAGQRQLADWLFAQGVTHIIGGHPHVVQPIELRTDSLGERHLLVYSLGNYISNMSAPNTDGGLMVNLTLEKHDGHTRLADSSYSLVWVSRPALSGRKPHRLYPADIPAGRLNEAERQRRDRFAATARALFSKYNRGGITEKRLTQ